MDFRIGGLFVWFENYELRMCTPRDVFSFVIGLRTLALTVRGHGFILHPGLSCWM